MLVWTSIGMEALALVVRNILGSSLSVLVLCVSLVKEIIIYIVAAEEKETFCSNQCSL
jgi:hypothetical protein